MTSKPTLLFIPDISGFTKFMSEANPDFSNQVIPALLNKIIYSNKLGLKVSEIEGDAVFFFKSDGLPNFRELIEQCQRFYKDFHEKLFSLEEDASAKNARKLRQQLGLKIIIHYGVEVGAVQIGTSVKLMGEDVITAHKLLKNDIEMSDYLLISEDLLKQYEENLEEFIDWSEVRKGSSEYEHIGRISYKFVDLQPLLNLD